MLVLVAVGEEVEEVGVIAEELELDGCEGRRWWHFFLVTILVGSRGVVKYLLVAWR